MLRYFGSCFILIMLVIWQPALAQNYYVIDPVHTRVAFHVMHAGFSPSLGTVSQPSGHIWFDDESNLPASVEIQFPINSLDMGDAKWNEKILSNTFLSAQQFPTAYFKSTLISLEQENRYRVEGLLSIAGKTVAIRFNATLNANKRHPLTLKQTLGLQASMQFSRKALGIDAWSSVVDDTVFMNVSIEAIRSTAPKAEEFP